MSNKIKMTWDTKLGMRRFNGTREDILHLKDVVNLLKSIDKKINQLTKGL